MNLKRQLLLVSLLALMLPWAGCEFIRETESALRAGQQEMLAGTARALANSMARYAEEFPDRIARTVAGEQIFLHALNNRPRIDGYIDDWLLDLAALKTLRGNDGQVRMAVGTYDRMVYLYVDVSDRELVYATAETMVLDDGPRYADRVTLVSSSPPYLEERIVFAAEAPGAIVSYRQDSYGFAPEPAITAYWQDVPGGYRIEAQIPADMLGTDLGMVVSNTSDENQRGVRISSYSGRRPPPAVHQASELRQVAENLVQTGMRILITDSAGWRIAAAGELTESTSNRSFGAGWSARIYDLVVEAGEVAASAEPDAGGREQQPYVSAALDGRETAGWFRGDSNGRAIVAVAAPIVEDGEILGALVVQQDTDRILSLTNEGLVRLINVTLFSTLIVAGALLGYASWLSRRVRRLSLAAEAALENETLHAALPSALAEDEIGDLSRSFSSVLRQLGDYNAYLRTLASKLSHELRTPLAIVTSSLENLEHESLSESSAGYTARAREGADRLRRILSAMSEASRVEESMANFEAESFDFRKALSSTIDAYRDVYAERTFNLDCSSPSVPAKGSPELLIQMLDKLVDNAVGFSSVGDTINIGLDVAGENLLLSVTNPGPPLPDRMRSQLFDSMVSVRGAEGSRHLGLGLYVAKLIAEGHGGSISAENVDGGVRFEVRLPA
ncbi:MAG: ATP-binding protein [Gammaproteobacteria bacterium]|nr:ATP-binding protein [Gammaproteobacteria bacterium]MDH5262719.1 ATP-binding protein [Gammaproteobacteria bacterium]MDH5583602.1 ATP-binding protein [Gammaproteobacteria bacterium]